MKFLHLNVNSIKKYKDELISTFPDIDCFSLNETKLNRSVASFSFPGFNIFRLDRSVNGSGVLIAVKQIFQTVLIEKGFVAGNEYVVIECKRKNKKPLTIVSIIYVPPQKVVCPDLLIKILRFNDHFLILGDFNANHIHFDCQKTNRNGRVLFNWVHEQSISTVGNNDATFQCNNYSSRLDWIFSDFEKALDCTNYTTHPLLGTTTTGHRPITFHLAYSFEKRFAESARKQFAFHRGNWTLYKSDVNRLLQQRKPQEVSNEADLIDYSKFLTDCIITKRLIELFVQLHPSSERIK